MDPGLTTITFENPKRGDGEHLGRFGDGLGPLLATPGRKIWFSSPILKSAKIQCYQSAATPGASQGSRLGGVQPAGKGETSPWPGAGELLAD